MLCLQKLLIKAQLKAVNKQTVNFKHATPLNILDKIHGKLLQQLILFRTTRN